MFPRRRDSHFQGKSYAISGDKRFSDNQGKVKMTRAEVLRKLKEKLEEKAVAPDAIKRAEQEVREYVNSENVGQCIKEGDVVFACVDNHKTRKVVSDYASKLNNILLISGGNEWVDGNIQIYSRKEGKDVTPRLTDYHPEISNPADQSPDEMSCEELSQSDPQLLFTNLSVATLMCWAYYNEVEKGKSGVSEVYFDINQMALDAKVREPKS